MIRNWQYTTPGWLMDRGTPTRMGELWEGLRSKFVSADRYFALKPWDTNWRSEARFIDRHSRDQRGVRTQPPNIVTVNYSYGAGYGLVQFAKWLGKLGLEIAHAYLIDPVYRGKSIAGKLLAFVPWWPIRIPANVNKVTVWRQKVSQPMGHKLKYLGDTVETDMGYVEVPHTKMDDYEPILHYIYDDIAGMLAA